MTLQTCYFVITLLICLCSLVTAKTKKSVKPTEEGAFECVSGERYQENKCNFCDCKNGELLGCSRTDCDRLPFYDMAKNCTIGNKWKEECNTCSCNKQYGTICTIKPCGTSTPFRPSKRAKKVGGHKGRTRAVLIPLKSLPRTQHHRLLKARATQVLP